MNNLELEAYLEDSFEAFWKEFCEEVGIQNEDPDIKDVAFDAFVEGWKVRDRSQ